MLRDRNSGRANLAERNAKALDLYREPLHCPIRDNTCRGDVCVFYHIDECLIVEFLRGDRHGRATRTIREVQD